MTKSSGKTILNTTLLQIISWRKERIRTLGELPPHRFFKTGSLKPLGHPSVGHYTNSLYHFSTRSVKIGQ